MSAAMEAEALVQVMRAVRLLPKRDQLRVLSRALQYASRMEPEAAAPGPSAAPSTQATARAQRDAEVMRLLGQGLRQAQIAAFLGVSKQRIGQLVTDLVACGALRRVGHGRYEVAAAGGSP